MTDLLNQALPFGPLALSLITIGLLLWANAARRRLGVDVWVWESINEALNLKQERIDRIERARTHAVAAAAAVEAAARQRQIARPAVSPPKPEVKPDPLQSERWKIQGWLSPTLEGLRQWSIAGSVDLASLSSAVRTLHSIDQAVTEAKQAHQLQTFDGDIWHVLPTLLGVVITKTDTSLDPGRTNGRLQAALNDTVESTGMSMIDPKPGEALDPAAHHTIGVTRGTSAQRGKVGEVRCRGLRAKSGPVVPLAEVREFD